MPEDNTASNTSNNTVNNGAAGGTVPNKTETQTPPAFDPGKVGDEDFAKVFEDPRLFNHPRFKELNERAKKAKEYEENQKKVEEESMRKKGEFEALAKTKEDEAKSWQQKFTQSVTDNRIQAEAAKLGAVDLEAVSKLIDRSKITVNDDGSLIGVEDAVKGLLEAKPYLKGSGSSNTTVGGATSPGSDNSQGAKRFKLSQLQDPKFYQANRDDIIAAQKVHLIEDDLHH